MHKANESSAEYRHELNSFWFQSLYIKTSLFNGGGSSSLIGGDMPVGRQFGTGGVRRRLESEQGTVGHCFAAADLRRSHPATRGQSEPHQRRTPDYPDSFCKKRELRTFSQRRQKRWAGSFFLVLFILKASGRLPETKTYNLDLMSVLMAHRIVPVSIYACGGVELVCPSEPRKARSMALTTTAKIKSHLSIFTVEKIYTHTDDDAGFEPTD